MHSAPYELVYDTDALKFLESVPPRKIKGQIKRRIDVLANDPIPSGAKKLQGITRKNGPIYRVRQGRYRIIYGGKGCYERGRYFGYRPPKGRLPARFHQWLTCAQVASGTGDGWTWTTTQRPGAQTILLDGGKPGINASYNRDASGGVGLAT